MADKNLFASLQKIASESITGQQPANDSGNQELMTQQDIQNIKGVAEIAKQMYPDNKQNQFNYWKKSVSLDGMGNDARSAYWKTYEDMHPRGIDGAKSDFVNTTLNEVSLVNGVSNKEFLLRERIANSPPWAQAALGPELAKYSTAVANSNLSKANQVYINNLSNNMNRMMVSAKIDPDVSTDQHTADFLKMEQMNLLDVGQIVNGRVGAFDPKGQFIPGFAINDRKQIFPNDVAGTPSAAEQMMVKQSAMQPIKDAIELNLVNQRSSISRQERLSAMQATNLLEQGHFPVERWGEAFSINPESDPQAQIERGLRGEINAGRIGSEKDLYETIYTAMVKYPTMFGDLNG